MLPRILKAKLNYCNKKLSFIYQRPITQESIVIKTGSTATSTTGSTPGAAAALSLIPAIIGVAVGLLILLLLVFS